MAARPPFTAPPPDVELTPFIDIVFQLLIFLMVANDLTRKEVEDLDLPEAPHPAADPSAPPGRLVVNLLPGPRERPPLFLVRGSLVDLDSLGRLLRDHRDLNARPSVLLRGDRTSPWLHVQLAMQACAAPGVEIDRIDFATDGAPPSREGR